MEYGLQFLVLISESSAEWKILNIGIQNSHIFANINNLPHFSIDKLYNIQINGSLSALFQTQFV